MFLRGYCGNLQQYLEDALMWLSGLKPVYHLLYSKTKNLNFCMNDALLAYTYIKYLELVDAFVVTKKNKIRYIFIYSFLDCSRNLKKYVTSNHYVNAIFVPILFSQSNYVYIWRQWHCIFLSILQAFLRIKGCISVGLYKHVLHYTF